ncbi:MULTISPECIES: P-type conjugative transfer ATPase TrbB [Kordiimonas]|jgi:type IV secretion system protein VirB11|uniref:P-type conjugative transfer ATPase TrbB n=1 Tax=Kordiimonas TaxID=288021 RepID=UPI00257EFE7C|nr:P-type conjugative transfer ATPase TrbB [Kordiimonas sp. UBA4487]
MTEPTALPDRFAAMLRTAMGQELLRWLDDPLVTELMINADGRLRIERHGDGICDTGMHVPRDRCERLIRLTASLEGLEVHAGSPILSAHLPIGGLRFEGLLLPVVTAPVIVMRKPAGRVYTLADYVAAGIMAAEEAEALRVAVRARHTILVAGGTGSGKTTLLNALLDEMADAGDRLVIIEDTRELDCRAEDCVRLLARPPTTDMRHLLRSTLRLRPDRIIVGEVRGGEALDMLKAWNTGHPGGIASLHANSGPAALLRLEQLVLEVARTVPKSLITEAIDLVVFIEGRGPARRLRSIETLGLDASGDYVLAPIRHPNPNPKTGDLS